MIHNINDSSTTAAAVTTASVKGQEQQHPRVCSDTPKMSTKEQCPYCGKWFSRLLTHWQYKERCAMSRKQHHEAAAAQRQHHLSSAPKRPPPPPPPFKEIRLGPPPPKKSASISLRAARGSRQLTRVVNPPPSQGLGAITVNQSNSSPSAHPSSDISVLGQTEPGDPRSIQYSDDDNDAPFFPDDDGDDEELDNADNIDGAAPQSTSMRQHLVATPNHTQQQQSAARLNATSAPAGSRAASAPPAAPQRAATQEEEAISFHYPTNHPNYSKILGPELLFQIRLADLLDHANTPLYLQDEIIKIVQDSAKRGLDFKRVDLCQRQTFVKQLAEKFPVPSPIILKVFLEGLCKRNIDFHLGPHDQVHLLVYDFGEQINDLYKDTALWGDTDNLVQQMHNPTKMFQGEPPTCSSLDEVVDAAWYRATCQQIRGSGILGTDKFFLVSPVVGYIDAAGTDHAYQRHGAEPFMFTTALLNRKSRNNFSSWRLLGYLPQLGGSSAHKSRIRSGGPRGEGVPTRNRHKCLAVMLRSLIKGQGLVTPIYQHIRVGDKVTEVRVFHPVCFVAADGQERDHLCGRKEGHKGARRISSACHTSFRNCDKTHHDCTWASQRHFHRISRTVLRLEGDLDGLSRDSIDYSELPQPTSRERKEARKNTKKHLEHLYALLKDLTQHCFISGFHGVWFGSNKHGINGATPTDLMHAFLNGVLPYGIKIFVNSMTPTEKSRLDRLVMEVMKFVRSSEKGNFPRGYFSKGVSNLTLVTSEEWAGIAFCLSLVLSTHEGRKLVDSVYERVRGEFAKEREEEEIQTATGNNSTASSDSEDDMANIKGIFKNIALDDGSSFEEGTYADDDASDFPFSEDGSDAIAADDDDHDGDDDHDDDDDHDEEEDGVDDEDFAGNGNGDRSDGSVETNVTSKESTLR